jgi:hypothetical protein
LHQQWLKRSIVGGAWLPVKVTLYWFSLDFGCPGKPFRIACGALAFSLHLLLEKSCLVGSTELTNFALGESLQWDVV